MGLIERFPEINFSNYSEDDVRALQTWGFEAYDELTKQAEAIRCLDIEAEEYEAHSQRLADLLSKIAVAIRGPEPPLTRYGWADLPDRVAKQAERVESLEGMLRDWVETVQNVDPGVYGDMIDLTAAVLSDSTDHIRDQTNNDAL